MKKKVLIWGTGGTSISVFEYLSNHREYEIVAFGDNNVSMVGKEYKGYKVYGKEELGKIDIDLIVIASIYRDEIYNDLIKFTSVEIISDVAELGFVYSIVDISSVCNARCKWCVTGRRNRAKGEPVCASNNRYMEMEAFKRLYKHLYDCHFIEKGMVLELYSWGEPLLNPDYLRIIEYLAEQKQRYAVSTNASILKLTDNPQIYEKCTTFCFSMCGFSQESFDRIHGLNFQIVKSNIQKMTKNIKESGVDGNIQISYHVYRFNKHEIEDARKFAEELGIRFVPYYPYFNGHSMLLPWMKGDMDEAIKQEAEKDMFLNNVPMLIQKRPNDYRCPLENMLTIDTDTNMVLCCAGDIEMSGYKFRSIYEFGAMEDLKKYRRNMFKCKICTECRALGADYWMNYNPSYNSENLWYET